MARCIKKSENHKPTYLRVQRKRVQRSLHKAPSTVDQNHAMIAVGNVQVRHLVKPACGALEVPGRSVGVRPGFKRSILGQGVFRRQ